MENRSLLKIPVQDIYYYRQLAVYNFRVHNLSSGNIKCYVFHKQEAGERPNEVTYIKNVYIKKDIDKKFGVNEKICLKSLSFLHSRPIY